MVEQAEGKLKAEIEDFEERRRITSAHRGRTPRRDASIRRGGGG